MGGQRGAFGANLAFPSTAQASLGGGFCPGFTILPVFGLSSQGGPAVCRTTVLCRRKGVQKESQDLGSSPDPSTPGCVILSCHLTTLALILHL